jgi:hypothetical protein
VTGSSVGAAAMVRPGSLRVTAFPIGLERVAAMLDEGPGGGAGKVLVAPNGHPDR